MKHGLILLLVLAALGCRGTAEFFSFTGKPESHDGWSHDYEATPADTWEAFRLVMKTNGSIEREDPVAMELRGQNKPPDSSERDGYNVCGRVYDKSVDGSLRSRLIVHAWYARSADGGERPDIAREYTNAVYRTLKAWKGEGEEGDKGRLDTTSEDPLQPDEAVAYFRVRAADVFGVCEKVARRYGSVEQSEKGKGFLRAQKKNALEQTHDDVRMNVYDRSEGGSVRVKVSVRVRDGRENKPLQEIAKAYVGEIRTELEKRFGEQSGG